MKRKTENFSRILLILGILFVFLLNILLLLTSNIPTRKKPVIEASSLESDFPTEPQIEANQHRGYDKHKKKTLAKNSELSIKVIKNVKRKRNSPINRKVSYQKSTHAVPLPSFIPYASKTIYLVFDDAGMNLTQAQAFIDFPDPVTIAVLPFLKHSAEIARKAAQAGHSVLLHLPLEAQGTNNPGPHAIFISQPDDEIRRLVRENIASLPWINGVNNHMGSKATTNKRVMRIVLDEVRRRNLFFLDSRTTAQTVIPDIAQELHVAYDSRSVFLDHKRDPVTIRKMIQKTAHIAEEKGYVIAIGHVTVPMLISILKDMYPRLKEQGYTFSALKITK